MLALSAGYYFQGVSTVLLRTELAWWCYPLPTPRVWRKMGALLAPISRWPIDARATFCHSLHVGRNVRFVFSLYTTYLCWNARCIYAQQSGIRGVYNGTFSPSEANVSVWRRGSLTEGLLNNKALPIVRAPWNFVLARFFQIQTY